MPQRLGPPGHRLPPETLRPGRPVGDGPVEVWLHATAPVWTQREALGPPLASESPAIATLTGVVVSYGRRVDRSSACACAGQRHVRMLATGGRVAAG
jgi:hypothetical protein